MIGSRLLKVKKRESIQAPAMVSTPHANAEAGWESAALSAI